MSEKNKKSIAKRYVVQRNELLYGKTNVFSVTDLKIFKLVISKVNSTNLLFDDFYEITTDELKEININEKHLYDTTVSSLKKLANVYMTINETNAKGEEVIKEVGLIQNNFEHQRYSGKFIISFHKDMRNYLLDIQQNYTKYPLVDISDLKLKHSLKFYEYMKSISFDSVVISIEKLKHRLDIPLNAYTEFGSFKRSVLVPVMDEINDKTSLTVDFEPVKDGRRVTKIKFIIKKRPIEVEITNSTKLIKKDDRFTPYMNRKFLYEGEEFQIISIDRNKFEVKVENLETNEIGTVEGSGESDLIEKLDMLLASE